MNRSMKTIVVKLGGTEGVDFSAICLDTANMMSGNQDLRMVFVHGGSEEANSLGKMLNYPPKFVTSPSGFTSRYTNRKTLEIFSMAVNGKINTFLVEKLQALGINALGLSGLDGRLIVATRKDRIRIIENGKQKILRDDFTGKIKNINSGLLENMLGNKYFPVIAPLAVSENGEALNIDADRAAAMISAAINADILVLLTAVPGLMQSFPDESTVIPRIPKAELGKALDIAQGRMKKKILGSQEAIEGGVGKVIIADGRTPKPISFALEGIGTVIS